jgi:predicted transcriptional regulator
VAVKSPHYAVAADHAPLGQAAALRVRATCSRATAEGYGRLTEVTAFVDPGRMDTARSAMFGTRELVGKANGALCCHRDALTARCNVSQ